MPDRVPHPRHRPPSRWDHVLAHAGTFAAALWWIVFGALLLGPALAGGPWYASPTLAQLPMWASVLTGTLLLAGGALAGWGIQTTTPVLDRAWRAQKTGLPLAAGGWVFYTGTLVVTNPTATVSIGSGLTHAAIAVLALIAVHRADAQIRQEVREQGMDA